MATPTAIAALFGVLAALGPLVRGASGAPVAALAHGARTFSLRENGSLHMTSKHNFTLNEQGSASGTITGTIYVHLSIVSTSRVSAEVNIYPRGGSISGNGTANYHRGSKTATFSGSASITRGTGTYAHARGSGLSFSGTITRSNDAITVHMSGRVSD
ncbi:MAG TPA: autotransporter [Solirubrobacteraceae bacterium]